MTRDDLRFTDHAAERLAQFGLTADDVLTTITTGEVIEDYPEHHRGPCQLSFAMIGSTPVHVVWAREAGTGAAVITVYIPDPSRWTPDFRSRRRTP